MHITTHYACEASGHHFILKKKFNPKNWFPQERRSFALIDTCHVYLTFK